MGSVYTYFALSEMQEFNVLDTQPAEAVPLREDMESLLIMWLVGSTIFLGLLLILVMSICLSQRARYQRQLKAATVNAFGISSSFEMFTSDNAMAVTDDPSSSKEGGGVHLKTQLSWFCIDVELHLFSR
jgi:hypothetical protein